jgi:hypothetical protein
MQVGERFFAHVPPAFCTMGTSSFLGVKRPGRGADHPLPSSAEVENEWSYTSTPPLGPWWSVIGWTLPLLSLFEWIRYCCYARYIDRRTREKSISLTFDIQVLYHPGRGLQGASRSIPLQLQTSRPFQWGRYLGRYRRFQRLLWKTRLHCMRNIKSANLMLSWPCIIAYQYRVSQNYVNT